MSQDLDDLFNEGQGNLLVDQDDWAAMLEEDANRPASPARKEVPDGQHTIRIKEAVLKPPANGFPAQIGVTIEFPEFNSLLWDNLPTNDEKNQLWRTKVFLSLAAGDDSWKDASKHADILAKVSGATGKVNVGRNKVGDKMFTNIKWIEIDSLPF